MSTRPTASPVPWRTLARLGLAFCAVFVPSCPRAPERTMPNVLVVVLDTLRPDHLGCYGYERESSPHLDALAQRFFVFENAQSCAPWTAPALISLMSSLYPDAHGVDAYPDPGRLSARATTLAEALRGRGYATAAITEGGYARGQFGLDQGFDLFLDSAGEEEPETFAAIHRRLEPNVDLALEWLAEQEEQPFFLFLHTFEVHSPRIPPTEFLRRFRPDFDPESYRAEVRAALEAWNERRELDLGRARLIQLESVAGEFEGLPFPQAPGELRERAAALGVELDKDRAADSPEVLAWVRDLYDAEIRRTDEQLQRIWSAFDEAGRWEDTIVVLVSDHGEGLGDHGRIGHGVLLHEELLRVLLMIHAPGAALEPRRVTELARSVDVMPTVLELAGVPAANLGLQGESLLPLMRGEPSTRIAFSHAPNSNRGRDERHSIRDGRWRLIHDADAHVTQLFDLATDPKESVDLAEREPERVARMLERLRLQRGVDAAVHARLGGAETLAGLDPEVLRELARLGYVDEVE